MPSQSSVLALRGQSAAGLTPTPSLRSVLSGLQPALTIALSDLTSFYPTLHCYHSTSSLPYCRAFVVRIPEASTGLLQACPEALSSQTFFPVVSAQMLLSWTFQVILFRTQFHITLIRPCTALPLHVEHIRTSIWLPCSILTPWDLSLMYAQVTYMLPLSPSLNVGVPSRQELISHSYPAMSPVPLPVSERGEHTVNIWRAMSE